MPSPLVKSFATKSKKSEKEVEALYKKAEAIVKDEYKDITVDSDKYYQLVTGVLKNMLGMNEEPAVTLADVPKHYKIDDLDKAIKKRKITSESILERLDGYLD